MNNSIKNGLPENPAAAKEKKKRGVKRLVFPVLLVLVLAAAALGYRFYYDASRFFTTDNAKVTAKMYSVLPVTSGKLLAWNVELGDLVTQDQILGRQEVLPYIFAPIDGTVVKNDATVNQTVAAGPPLAVIADTENLYIGVNIEETDIAKIRLGQKADVHIDAYPGRVFGGQVTEINQATQTYFAGASSFTTSGTYTKVTQLIPVKITIENEEGLPLTFGLNATVKIHLQ
ncbi:MAG: HlyD family efflux transporter periplasmic adaptor subunit [Clostridiales bacterium]